jgi:hypothetical protein
LKGYGFAGSLLREGGDTVHGLNLAAFAREIKRFGTELKK